MTQKELKKRWLANDESVRVQYTDTETGYQAYSYDAMAGYLTREVGGCNHLVFSKRVTWKYVEVA